MAVSRAERASLVAAMEAHVGGRSTRYASVRMPSRTVYLLVTEDTPRTGLATAATIGMSDAPMQDGERYEVLAAGRGDALVSLVAAAAEVLLAHRLAPREGRPFSGLAELAGVTGVPPHGVFLAPSPWDEWGSTLSVGDHQIRLAWLALLDDEELAALHHQGLAGLESLLGARGADLLDRGSPT